MFVLQMEVEELFFDDLCTVIKIKVVYLLNSYISLLWCLKSHKYYSIFFIMAYFYVSGPSHCIPLYSEEPNQSFLLSECQ